MISRELPKAEWQSYFDLCSKSLGSKEVKVEIVGMDIGDQLEEDWTRLNGFSYDSKSDTFYVHTSHLEHAISQPRKVYVIEEGSSLNAVEVEDDAGNKQIMRLKSPLMLRGAS